MTLVEVAVVVVIVGVLAVIAVVGYRRYVRAGRMAEADHVVTAIMTAQHNYRAERGVYANVSTTDLSFYPNATPVGNRTTQWGGPCGAACVEPRGWEALAVNVNAPVMFGYATVAGIGGQPQPPPENFVGAPVPPPVAPIAIFAAGANEPFFVITAALDYDRNGTYCQVTAVSGSNQVFVSNAGE